MKAIIYIRVSDARQSDGTSLEQQEQFCREWCNRNGIEVVKVYIEAGASAKTANRPQFQAMFAWLQSKKNRAGITHLVVDKWDRFSRSMEDGVQYRIQLQAMGIALVSATQPVTDDPAGRLLQNILQSFGQFDNEQRAERSVRGMKAAAERGRFVNPAPIGYKNNGKKTPSLVVDEQTAPLVRGMYERVAAGHTLTDALKWARLHGLRGRRGATLTMQTASLTLRKVAYKGWLQSKGKHLRGLREGDWEPIVEPELWAKVQTILDGKSGALQVPHYAANAAYVLKGLLVCETCGKVLLGSAPTSKSGKRHSYYHCSTKGCSIWLPVKAIDAAFESLLESLEPDAGRITLMRSAFMEAWERLNGSAAADRARLSENLETLKRHKSRLLTMALDDKISDADFETRSAQLNEQIAAAETALSGIAEDLDADTKWSFIEHLLYNLHVLWNQRDAAEKRAFGRLIFPAGLNCSKTGLGTPLVANFLTTYGQKDELVALTGIEPVF